MKVCIDAGHGGSDPGALGRFSTEAALNLDIAWYLEDALFERGYETLMTRRVDRTLSLNSRSSFANRLGADLFVSVHCNAAGGASANGMETWVFPNSRTSRPIATSVQAEMIRAFPTHRDRGVKEANFHVLRKTTMSAILVECEFLTTPRQERFLMGYRGQFGLAQAIATGIDFSLQTI